MHVVENWNSANRDLFYGKDGELTGKDKESQEISMLALHLLQSALLHVNTLLVQEVLAEPKWSDKLTEADWRGHSPAFLDTREPLRQVRAGHEPPPAPRPAPPTAANAPGRCSFLRHGTGRMSAAPPVPDHWCPQDVHPARPRRSAAAIRTFGFSS
ncbi:Tn3 family transposase [Streptomyces sp. NBC_00151]|uniref:Tn3 family transposase n=1 Tax=Streptomyces sp. NBC_00151 TaxID=2975669 RepID=UPI002DD8DB89|nr:Tn3 family transposase [Streptomyces sp. NBC_00151]WRZ37409.1 transposase [Streptomyces sp. NBC_00151]